MLFKKYITELKKELMELSISPLSFKKNLRL